MVRARVTGLAIKTTILQGIRLSYRTLKQNSVWKLCREFTKRHLLLVNTGTCTTLYVTGDLIQQHIEGCKVVNWHRTLRMATLGMCMGPLNHGWYKLLDSVLVGVSGRIVLKKVLADQLVMAPICCSFFYMGMCTLEGRGYREGKAELKAKFWPTYKTDWQLWPLAQTINFFFVPTHWRVTYVNIVTLFWTVYLSYMKHKWKQQSSSDSPS